MATDNKTSESKSAIEELLGDSLMTRVGKTVKTPTALKDAELVALYFSASWCPPCQKFTPQLIDFYNKACSGRKVACIFISSDRSMDAFTKYYGKMPWLAIPPDSPTAKQKLADSFKIQGIPSLVVIDAKNGYFVTDRAREDVSSAAGSSGAIDEQKAKDVVTSWKAKEAVPISQASLGGQSGLISTLLSYLMKNPAFIFALIYFGKRIYKYLLELGREGNAEL